MGLTWDVGEPQGASPPHTYLSRLRLWPLSLSGPWRLEFGQRLSCPLSEPQGVLRDISAPCAPAPLPALS